MHKRNLGIQEIMSRILLKNVIGFAGRQNDVLYMQSTAKTNRLLIFFGGDCQDLREKMLEHNDSRKYVEWNLENTIEILSKEFPHNHIIVIRPSRMTLLSNVALSCFDNFVQCDKYGIPQFGSPHTALKHLQSLIENLKTSAVIKTEQEINDEKYNNMELKLIGFSKGCVVLNQILHEFCHFQENMQSDIASHIFIKSIKSMWWLDGGHMGNKNTWITDQHILQVIAKLGVKVYIHVTPYQIQDVHRPWIGQEETSFYNNLQKLEVPVERTVHFTDKQRSLHNHFQVLKSIKEVE